MAMVDARGPGGPGSYQLPHRTPGPGPTVSARSDGRPINRIVPDIALPSNRRPQPTSSATAFPPRTSSQNPVSSPSQAAPFAQSYAAYNSNISSSRRTPSQSTTSTGFTPSRTPSNVSSAVSRTSSTRSGASTTPGSYVALMRKQKATVWCDRSQHEDPRIVAQHKAARIRAAREITGVSEARNSTSGNSVSGSLGVRSKIRHHGVPKASGYSHANMVGGGVPMRLSANEVGDEGTYSGSPGGGPQLPQHQRNSSARSSMINQQYLNIDQKKRQSLGSVQGNSSFVPTSELEETPGPGPYQSKDYFTQETKEGHGGSGGSSERENGFGEVKQMKAPHVQREGKTSDELRRRGSVDERANTMSLMGGRRLFVANPDLSD